MERLLSLIELTKGKQKLLDKMMHTELEDNPNFQEYQEYLQEYKTVCYLYDKKLNQISDTDKISYLEKMIEINPNINRTITLEQLSEFNPAQIVLARIKMDLGNFPFIKGYIKAKATNPLQFILSQMTGGFISDREELEINEDSINHYFSQDIMNCLYYFINQEINQCHNKKTKEFLTKYKYRILLLSSDLESRMLLYLNDVTSMNNIKLQDRITIETTNMSLEEYMKNLDNVIITWSHNMIRFILMNRNPKDFVVQKVLLKTIMGLLSDKEYCDIIFMELEEVMDEEIPCNKQRLKQIKNILMQSKEIEFNTVQNRKYKKI